MHFFIFSRVSVLEAFDPLLTGNNDEKGKTKHSFNKYKKSNITK